MDRKCGICAGIVGLLFGVVCVPMVVRAEGFDCLVEPRQMVEIKSPVQGLIEKITVDRGDFVKAGQVLVVLDSEVEMAAAELAKYRAEMQGAIKSSESRVEYSTRKAERRQELHGRHFVSSQEHEEAETEKRLAEAELIEAKDNRRVAELEYRRTREVLNQRTIKSPFSGLVMERFVHPGEVAEAAEGSKAIIKLADIDTLYVEVLLPVEAYGAVRDGMPVEVIPEPPIKGKYAARVKVVDRVLDAGSGTFGARLELPNPDRAIPVGIRCKAVISGVDVSPRGVAPSANTPQKTARPSRFIPGSAGRDY